MGVEGIGGLAFDKGCGLVGATALAALLTGRSIFPDRLPIAAIRRQISFSRRKSTFVKETRPASAS